VSPILYKGHVEKGKLTNITIEIKRNFNLLEKAVETVESRYTTRVLRTLPSVRRRLTSDMLAQIISDYYDASKL
jgi:26S proteasome regulatory subunit N3